MPRSRGRKGKKPQLFPSPRATASRLSFASRPILLNGWIKIAGLIVRSWKLVGVVSVVVGLMAGAVLLYPPRITIELFGDNQNPYFSSFVIRNSWVLPVRDVVPFLGLCELYLSNPSTVFRGDCSDRGAVRLIPPKWRPRNLSVDEKFTAAISDIFKFDPDATVGGDITMGLTFKPWISPFTSERMFRFIGQKSADGKYRWLPEALEEK
jgi:hypothetical protein